MGNMRNEQEWAIFLAAVCGQTYAQFEHADGSFVVPADFSVVHNLRARSMGGISEPFGFILNLRRRSLLPGAEAAQPPIGSPT